ncbi:hypothetical protein POM88_024666 [Heracleum sosnowskyi]|uniref:Uncharacterized protein n=1 Tax=Heracleum sosnowskyi TaxID=360622 RepID=A0AAD8I4I7_9APIA|nr:hypothetical protein POM88_024666 [Heracleum sosnowskyi]
MLKVLAEEPWLVMLKELIVEKRSKRSSQAPKLTSWESIYMKWACDGHMPLGVCAGLSCPWLGLCYWAIAALVGVGLGRPGSAYQSTTSLMLLIDLICVSSMVLKTIANGFVKIFHKRTPPEAVDLVSRLLQYSPNLRSTAGTYVKGIKEEVVLSPG